METKLSNTLDHWARLVHMEWEASSQQHSDKVTKSSLDELCADGVCLRGLQIIGSRSQPHGQVLLKFALLNRQPLPDHKLVSGDQLHVSSANDFRTSLGAGRVMAILNEKIHLVLSWTDVRKFPTPGKGFSFVLLQAFNPTTHQRLTGAIETMRDPNNWVGARLISYLIREREMPFVASSSSFYQCDSNLNESQQKAVSRCVDIQRPVNVIHGPPGTGKTQTLIEIIAQCVMNNGEKLLVCAPSNVAVDNLMQRVLREYPKIKALRLGNPARISCTLRALTFEVKLRKALKKRKEEIIGDDNADDEAESTFESEEEEKSEDSSETESSEENSQMVRQNRTTVDRKLINSAQVVFSTLTSCPKNQFPLKLLSEDNQFDVCIIDECAQATEVACWVGLMQARRCVLAGDHSQLPPTVISQKASNEGMSISLMKRLDEEFRDIKKELFTMLSVQYRMNGDIMKWSSDMFYDSKLTAHPTVDKHLLSNFKDVHTLPNVSRKLRTLDCPLVLIDTGRRNRELGNLEISHGNPSEVRLVFLYVRLLIDQGIKMDDIAIISPYSKQVQMLLDNVGRAFPGVAKAIRSVDGFQGQEREVVVLSLVRSNQTGRVGFLSDSRRLNVAITRARRHVCVIADVGTVSSDRCIRSLMHYIRENERAVYYKHHELLELDSGVPFILGQAELRGQQWTTETDSVANDNATEGQPPQTQWNAELQSAICQAQNLSVIDNIRKAKSASVQRLQDHSGKNATPKVEPTANSSFGSHRMSNIYYSSSRRSVEKSMPISREEQNTEPTANSSFGSQLAVKKRMPNDVMGQKTEPTANSSFMQQTADKKPMPISRTEQKPNQQLTLHSVDSVLAQKPINNLGHKAEAYAKSSLGSNYAVKKPMPISRVDQNTEPTASSSSGTQCDYKKPMPIENGRPKGEQPPNSSFGSQRAVKKPMPNDNMAQKTEPTANSSFGSQRAVKKPMPNDNMAQKTEPTANSSFGSQRAVKKPMPNDNMAQKTEPTANSSFGSQRAVKKPMPNDNMSQKTEPTANSSFGSQRAVKKPMPNDNMAQKTEPTANSSFGSQRAVKKPMPINYQKSAYEVRLDVGQCAMCNDRTVPYCMQSMCRSCQLSTTNGTPTTRDKPRAASLTAKQKGKCVIS